MNTRQTTNCLYRFLFLFLLLLSFGKHIICAEVNLNALYSRADTLLKEKQYLEALTLFEELLSRDPLFVEGYRALIECYRALGDTQGAAIFIESLYLENPDNPGVNYGMGYSLFNQKKYAEAGRYFDKAIQLKPDLAEAWNNRAVIFQFIEKNNDKALQYYEKAINIAEKSGNQRVVEIAQKNLAHIPKKKVLHPVTDTLTLEAFLNRLIDAVDKNDETRMKELILGQRQNSEKAMAWLIDQAMLAGSQKTKEDEKKFVLLAQVLAHFYRENFNSSLLLDKLQGYQDLSDEYKQSRLDGEVLLQEGMVFEENQQYQEAIASYQKSLFCFKKIHDNDRTGIVYAYLGDAYFKSKEFASACEAYRNSLAYLQETVDTKNKAHILASLGSACFHAGDYDRAVDFLNQSITLYRKINDEDSIKKIEKNIQLVKNKLE